MSLDLFLRAPTAEKLVAWLTKPNPRSVIGDLRARDEEGAIISPAALASIPGNVDIVEFPEDSIVEVPTVVDGEGAVVTPAVMDPQAWVHVRLTGAAEVEDFAGPPRQPHELDRWEHSKIVNIVKEDAVAEVHRGVATYEYKSGPSKGISIFRGSEVQSLIPFHEYLGGNTY